MYHPHPKFLALFAAILIAFAPMSALAQLAALFGTAPITAKPDPIDFRVQMELGDIGRARAWLDVGLDPNYLGDRIGSGLMIAAWEGNIPLMELFATRGADVNLTNRLGETALMHAAWKGHSAAVRWLIAHGAKVEREAMQWTALHYAVFAGHRDIADLLLERGADINARSPNGSSVLMMAVYEGREDMARRLLARGADPRLKNENGHGALDWAMKFSHTNIARLVATPQEFQVAASRPKSDWGDARKSEPAPKDLEDLVNIREILAAHNMSVDKIDRNIAALRAKYARASLKREAPPPASVLEIVADRNAPGKQRMRMVINPTKQ